MFLTVATISTLSSFFLSGSIQPRITSRSSSLWSDKTAETPSRVEVLLRMSDDEDGSYGYGGGGGYGGDYGGGGGERGGSGRARRKNAKYYNTNYEQDVDLEDSEDDDDEEPTRGVPGGGMMVIPRIVPQQLARNRGRPKKAVKKCPGCDELVKASSTTCEVCDYVFTSAKAQAMEEVPIADRFSFEPELVRWPTTCHRTFGSNIWL